MGFMEIFIGSLLPPFSFIKTTVCFETNFSHLWVATTANLTGLRPLGPIITKLVQSSQILSISLFLKEFFQRHSNKLLSSLFSKNHLYPLMISTTFVQFQTSTSFSKFSKKLLPPAFNLTCLLLTLCILLFNLLTGSFILLKLYSS